MQRGRPAIMVVLLLLLPWPMAGSQFQSDPDHQLRPGVMAHAVATVDRRTGTCPSGCVYIFGGWDGANPQSSIYRYDGETLRESSAALVVPRYAAAAASDGNRVFIFGGYREPQVLDDILGFDPEGPAFFENTARLPWGLLDHEAVWAAGAIYIFGGQSSAGASRAILRYEPNTDRLTTLSTQMPVTLLGTRAVWDGRTVWILGGQTPDGVLADEVYRFDPTTQTVLPHNNTLPGGRAFGEALWDGGHVYYFGGAGPEGPLDQTLRLDPRTGRVDVLVGRRLPEPRMKMGGGVLDGVMYLFGGEGHDGIHGGILSLNETKPPPLPIETTSPTPNATQGQRGGPVVGIQVPPVVWLGLAVLAVGIPVTVAVLRPKRRPTPAAPAPVAQPAGAALVVRDLRVERQGRGVVDGIGFEVPAGTVVCLLGMSGSGKSTLLQALVGLAPSKGEIEVGPNRLQPGSLEARQIVGYVPQELQLYENLTPVANLEYFASQYAIGPREARRRAESLLRDLGLESVQNRPLGQMSGGQRRRVSIGASLVHAPAVLLLDEPTSGLDFSARKSLWDVLGRLARGRGVGILASTHFIDDAERADLVGIMTQGRLVAFGSPRSLVRSLPGRGRCVELEFEDLTPQQLSKLRALLPALRALGLAERAEYQPLSVRYFSKDPATAAQRLPAEHHRVGLAVRSTRIDDVTLEDVFVYHTGGVP